MDEIIETQKRGRPAKIGPLDVFCLRAYVLDRRTMQDIGDELHVTKQRVKARLNRFGVSRGGSVVGEVAHQYLERIQPEAERADTARECACGMPGAPGVFHRTDGPCYYL